MRGVGWGLWVGEGDKRVRITAGDTDGDLVDEILGLWDNGYWGFFDDEIYSFAAIEGDEGGEFYSFATTEIDGYTETLDVAVADTDLDELDDLIVLAEDAQVIGFRATSSTGNLSRRFATTLDVSVAPDRVAMADHDGDAPKARLVGEPERCQGGALPLMVMTLPPYHRDFSASPSRVGFGDGESTSETLSDTVSMGLSVDVGVGGSFMDIFGAKLSTKVSTYVSQTTSVATTLYMGNRFSMTADPDLYGPNYGGVVLAWGCFDAYTYAIDDPADHIGEVDDEAFILVTPSGGGVTMYSTARYNAMAEALGDLPVVEVPWTVGDISTYPSTPTRLDGQALDEDDMIFPNPGEYTVSDVGDVSWWNSVGETETNSTSTNVDLGVSASITVGGVTIGGGGSYGWGSAYSLSVGTNALFSGTLPALPDDPNTPEDEYAAYAYQASPYVYVHRYEDQSGNPSAFYAMSYTVNE